jgi:uncharacterized RDD family membrane protein YckC
VSEPRVIECRRCRLDVSFEAPRCPECGADPRTGLSTLDRKGTDRVRVCEGVRVRGLAFAIDAVVLMASFVVVMIAVFLVLAGKGEFAVVESGPPPSVAPYWLAFCVVAFLYFWLFEGLRGRTLGKRLCGLRVLDLDGGPAGLGAAFWRTVLRVVDWLPTLYLLGAIVMTARARNQRVGDLVAHTVVTRTRVVELRTLDAPYATVIPWPGDTATSVHGRVAGAH